LTQVIRFLTFAGLSPFCGLFSQAPWRKPVHGSTPSFPPTPPPPPRTPNILACATFMTRRPLVIMPLLSTLVAVRVCLIGRQAFSPPFESGRGLDCVIFRCGAAYKKASSSVFVGPFLGWPLPFNPVVETSSIFFRWSEGLPIIGLGFPSQFRRRWSGSLL